MVARDGGAWMQQEIGQEAFQARLGKTRQRLIAPAESKASQQMYVESSIGLHPCPFGPMSSSHYTPTPFASIRPLIVTALMKFILP